MHQLKFGYWLVKFVNFWYTKCLLKSNTDFMGSNLQCDYIWTDITF